MMHTELENQLKKRIRIRRITEGILTVIFLVISVLFTVLYENSRTVEAVGRPPFVYESVTYNYNYIWGTLIGCLGLLWSVIFLVTDLIFTRLQTVEAGADHITFYRGMLRVNIFVNGEYKDGLPLAGYYLEAPLSDGTKVTVSLGKWSAHLTFSNGHQPIDL